MKKEMLVIKEENAILGILPDEMLKNIAGGKIKDTADKGRSIRIITSVRINCLPGYPGRQRNFLKSIFMQRDTDQMALYS